MINDVIVSICCTAFNHDKYIAQTIESFIMQKCSYKYEIVIHDDASTDQTSAIIKDYEILYPDIIKAIYQDTNKHSQGINIYNEYIYPRSSGKYIAMCEGDDYWTDPIKLQKQVDYLEEHQDCTFCFTNAMIHDESGVNRDRVFIPYSKENTPNYSKINKRYSIDEILKLGFIPYASFVFPKVILNDFPDFFYQKHPAGDIKLKLIATGLSYAYFINDTTCVYRSNVPGSAMSRWHQYNKKKRIALNQGFINLLDSVDQWTNKKHHQSFDEAKIPYEAIILASSGDKKLILKKRYHQFLKNLPYKQRMKLYGMVLFPKLYNFIKQSVKIFFKWR